MSWQPKVPRWFAAAEAFIEKLELWESCGVELTDAQYLALVAEWQRIEYDMRHGLHPKPVPPSPSLVRR